ncbi:sugar-binding domain-containing protein [Edaphobacter sp. 12200R-103]|uniref:sugar-binding domain-containing protein n=1 Tax=Edaphobacter sp. 12200R-103 TaxID=2703788 RepID=UPI00138D1289|nr:hypothetical protein GWR55_01810 [Edaphobacter sp. 12200R-103]
MREPYARDAVKLFDRLDTVLVGISALEPSRPLLNSGNVFSAAERSTLASKGAIGDICLQYFKTEGYNIPTPLTERVIGIKLSQLKRVKNVIGWRQAQDCRHSRGIRRPLDQHPCRRSSCREICARCEDMTLKAIWPAVLISYIYILQIFWRDYEPQRDAEGGRSSVG